MPARQQASTSEVSVLELGSCPTCYGYGYGYGLCYMTWEYNYSLCYAGLQPLPHAHAVGCVLEQGCCMPSLLL